MARKQRDYKKEYAARKAKARAAGYKSVGEYSKARKSLGVPRNASPIPKRIAQTIAPATFVRRTNDRYRREAKAWSDIHSHVLRSRYMPDMSDAQVREYHYAYVQRVEGMSRRKKAQEKRKRIWAYLKKWFGIEEEFDPTWRSDLGPA